MPLARDSLDSPRSELMSVVKLLTAVSSVLPNCVQPALLRPQRVDRFRDRDFGKADIVSGTQLADTMHVCGDNIRHLRIAARSLLVDEQDNRLAILRHLDGPERDAVRQQLSGFAG